MDCRLLAGPVAAARGADPGRRGPWRPHLAPQPCQPGVPAAAAAGLPGAAGRRLAAAGSWSGRRRRQRGGRGGGGGCPAGAPAAAAGAERAARAGLDEPGGSRLAPSSPRSEHAPGICLRIPPLSTLPQPMRPAQHAAGTSKPAPPSPPAQQPAGASKPAPPPAARLSLPQIRHGLWVRNGDEVVRLEFFYNSQWW